MSIGMYAQAEAENWHIPYTPLVKKFQARDIELETLLLPKVIEK